MKHLILLFILATSIFGVTINDSLLNIHATLIPKISLMDYEFKNKINDNTIVIAILYSPSNYKNALSLKKKIDVKYGNGIKSYKIKAKLVSFSTVNSSNANIYYIFPTNKQNIETVINKAKRNQALTFSYLKEDLKYGVMLSLNIAKKIRPIVNLDAIRESNITFRPVLLDISKIYINSKLNIPSSFLESFYFQERVA